MLHFWSLVLAIGGGDGGVMTVRDRLLAVGVAVLWGGNFLAIHIGLAHFPPLFLAALRFAVLAVPTLLLVPRPRVPLRWLFGYGLGFGTVQFVFLFLAMDIGMPTGLASLVLQASAPFTVLLGVVLLRERTTLRQRFGIGLAVLGLAGIAVDRAQSATLLPVLLTLLGALGWAFGNLAGRLAVRDAHADVNPLHLTLWMTTIPPLPLLAISWLTEGPAEGWAALRPPSPRPACPGCSPSATSRCWPPCSAPASGPPSCVATRQAWWRPTRCWSRWSDWRWRPPCSASGRARWS
jgi:drug/metabolite transporter (DMT)-like permease